MAKIKGVKNDLSKWKIKETDLFSKQVTKASKLASVELQRDINRRVDKPTNFTRNAVGFKFRYDKNGSKNRIFIKDVQAQYLAPLIDSNKPVDKFVPVPGSTNAFGNIAGLRQRRNLEEVKQRHNGTERTILIKTTAKRNKRIVAIFERNKKRRKTIGSWDKISDKIFKTVNRVAGTRR